jgi:hypothetical protein
MIRNVSALQAFGARQHHTGASRPGNGCACPAGNAVKDFEPENCLVSNPDGGAIMPAGQIHPLPGLISLGSGTFIASVVHGE